MAENNPLQKYFRQPSIYVKLPSEGKFYPPGTLDMPVNGEIPVYPMTAMDEIVNRTPDALFNGSAVAEIFKSCIPNIKDPWAIPQTDVDMLLTAVRIASYGHEMEMTVTCPHCNESQDYALDLRVVIDQYQSPDYSKPAQISDLEIFFKPMSYHDLNETAKAQFEQQKVMQMTQANADIPDEDKMTALGQALTNVTKLTMGAMAHSIAMVRVNGEPVDNPKHIKEFMDNCDTKIFNRIRDHLSTLREGTELRPLSIKCSNEECGKEYQQPFTLDMSNFFV
jgi:hypothetical protein